MDWLLSRMFLQYCLVAAYRRTFGNLRGFLQVVLLPVFLTIVIPVKPLETGILLSAFFIARGTLSEYVIDHRAEREPIR